MTKFLQVTLVTMLTAALLATPALAKDHHHDRDHHRNPFEHRDRDHDRDWARAHHRDHDRDRDRHHREFRRVKDDPPGWEHGRKTGWHGSDVPPGQARKNHHDYGHDRHVSAPVSHVRPAPARAPAPRPHPVTTSAPNSGIHRPTDLIRKDR